MTWDEIAFLQKPWIKKSALVLSNLLTLGNIALAILAIVFIFKQTDNYVYWIAKFLAICGIFDFADGKLARIGGSKVLAIDVDTITDSVAFGLLPAIFIGYQVYSLNIFVGIATGFLYLAAVWFRLYRFTKRDPLYTPYFQGLPSPFAAVVIACLVIFYQVKPWEFIVTAVILSGFMISKTPFPSFKGVPSKFDLFWIGSTTIIFLAFIFLPTNIMIYAGYPLSAYMIIYLIFGPDYAIKLEKKKQQKKLSEKKE